MPSGKYLMEDFCYAGGLPAVLRELGENGQLHKDALTVNGKTIWENNKDAPCWNRDVIIPFKKPFKKNAGIKVLRGNLAPDGAIIKPSAATPALLKHKGRAVVFENIEDFHTRIDDPKLDIDENCVMVLKNCGPKGYPGMAEVGNMPLPPKLLKKGVTDMVRVSDARMSGTAYGTVVLHASPEAAAGGLLALVAERRPGRAGCFQGQPSAARGRERNQEAQSQMESAQAARSSAATGACITTTSTRRTRAPTSTSWSARAAVRAARQPLRRKPWQTLQSTPRSTTA